MCVNVPTIKGRCRISSLVNFHSNSRHTKFARQTLTPYYAVQGDRESMTTGWKAICHGDRPHCASPETVSNVAAPRNTLETPTDDPRGPEKLTWTKWRLFHPVIELIADGGQQISQMSHYTSLESVNVTFPNVSLYVTRKCPCNFSECLTIRH